MTKEEIKEYYNSCCSSNIDYASKKFEENGRKNDWYFLESTYELYNLWNKEVNKNIAFSEETKKYLKIENRQLHYLFNDIFKLFHRVWVFEKIPTGEVKSINPIFRTEYDIQRCFSRINFHSLFINTLIENNQFKEAIAVKGYLLTRINTIIINSEDLFGISLLKSPLAEYFNNYISSLEKSINIEELKLSLQLEEPEKKQPIKEEPKQDKSIVLIDLIDHHSGKKTYYQYERLLKDYKENRFAPINTNNRKYTIYSADIFYALSSDAKGKYNDTDEVFNIDEKPYLKTFTDAYEEGEEQFKKKYEVSKDTLYGLNSKVIIADIHQGFYHSRFASFKGWNYVINVGITQISHKIIEEHGYYSGMLSSALQFIKEYPIVFKDIDKCNHSATTKEKPQQEKKLTKEQIFEGQNNLISTVSIKDVYNYFKTLTEVTNINGVFYLTEEKLLLFIKSTFIDLKPIHIDFNIPFSRDKKSVRSVFKKFEIECNKFEKNTKNLKEKYTKIMMETFTIFNDNDFKKWHETDNKIPTIKIKRVNKSI